MVKITGKLIIEKHNFNNIRVKRPYGNEYIVEPEPSDTLDDILKATQKACSIVAPYARNCPPGNWTGRGTTYVTIQPISGKMRDDFAERIHEIKVSNACLMRERDFDGRIQLIVFTPSPDDRPVPAEWEDDNTHISRRRSIILHGRFDDEQ